MRHAKVWIGAGAAAVAAAGAIATMGVASAGHDSEEPITGDALERASTAALEHTGGGSVTDTEVGDEEGFYEVEVTLDDGTQVDVHLNKDFTVLSDETDGAGDAEESGGG